METKAGNKIKDKMSDRTRHAVWLFSALTFIWLSWISWLTYTGPATKCSSDESGVALLWGWCLTLNEVGDTLAGVFAPLAFLWLVAAVLLQSQELAAQRRELELTREEFKESRKVAKAQAEEARKQAEYIGTQTEILNEERELRRAEQANREVDARVSDLFNSLSVHCTEGSFTTGIKVKNAELWICRLRGLAVTVTNDVMRTFSLGAKDLEALVRLSTDILEFSDIVYAVKREGELQGFELETAPFNMDLVRKLQSLAKVRGTTRDYEFRLEGVKFGRLLSALEGLIDEISNFEA